MKRDVKVGLFVAAVVCGVAALLLGGGMVGRPKAPAAALRVEASRSPSGSLPAEFTGTVLPPEDAERLADEIVELSPDEEAIVDAGPADAYDDEVAEGTHLETIVEADEIAERVASLLEAPPSAAAPPPVVDAAEEVEVVEMSEADLLRLELDRASEALEAPAEPLEPEESAADVLTPVIAPPTETIAVPIALPVPAKYVYVMEQGDSYWTVARKIYGAGKYFKNIYDANPDIEPMKLRPKDRIAIPEIAGVAMRRDLLAAPEDIKAKHKPRVYLAQDREHEIQPGETLEDIARMYYGYTHKWPHILKVNPGLDPMRLQPGKGITVPALME
jgi:nucleoid-associated protein YgaU